MLHRFLYSSCAALGVLGLAVLFTNCSGAEPQSGFSDTTEAKRVEAARVTATTNSNCTAINPFYWEIGNVSSLLASGSTGNGSVLRTTDISLGSASDWLVGAYIVQAAGGAPSTADIPYLTMTSGYTSFGRESCTSATTVQDCLNASNGNGGSNATYTSGNDGKFFYNGGHAQAWAVQEGGLSSDTKTSLTTKFRTSLGSVTQIEYEQTRLANAVKVNSGEYVSFLRRIISGQLLMKNYLGEDAVCTLPASSGCNAASSPYTLAFHYSYGHWVEDDPTGDGSFSSAGTNGFYGWIDKTKKFYGVIARNQAYSGTNELGHGVASYQCGKAIRRAYMTATAQ